MAGNPAIRIFYLQRSNDIDLKNEDFSKKFKRETCKN